MSVLCCVGFSYLEVQLEVSASCLRCRSHRNPRKLPCNDVRPLGTDYSNDLVWKERFDVTSVQKNNF